ncbi:hypothetical protein DDB_G0278553 [Dictyostelium discoideum AX4]|uniref:Carbohydrate binding domain-containing protein n=1 Tax=Dictyostelium discoideum TaxID=44689 RepID=Q54XW3_DICDI|nr:hypothetical protein DDB_G0278553 [Dictyostelium discoideum AX4]EAL68449.1 hypothetical protein DDB_G0278553 [Dictyostelium discoideum AX4]|eukprot:XP_642439.1 hypothetical protein DDB_G0278553 [Dictyostelium discoideum AX4]
MKFLAVLCIFIFTFVFAYGCKNSPCGAKEVSVTSNGSCKCVKASDFNAVTVETTKQSEWDVGVTHFSRYGVQVHNNGDSTATDIHMGFDPKAIGQAFDISSDIPDLLNPKATYVQFPKIEKNSSSGFNFTIPGRNEPYFVIDAANFNN